MTTSFDSGAAAPRRSAISRTTSAILHTRSLSLSLSLSSATVIVLLASARVSWGQLDASDPWPKFGRDERNSCYSPVRGAHAPELRWWAPLGTAGSSHHAGVAIANVDGVNYAIVGTSTAIGSPAKTYLHIFKINDSGYGPSAAATPTQSIELPAADDLVNSTPLVLPNKWVVVQTDRRLIAYDISSLPSAPVFKWQSVSFASAGASPAYGLVNQNSSTARLFAQGVVSGNIVVASIDPTVASTADRSFDWQETLRTSSSSYGTINCPALGTLDINDPLYGSNDGVRLLYCATIGNGGSSSTAKDIFAVFSDGATHGTSSRIVWQFRMDNAGGPITVGTFASPSVHLPGSPRADKVVVTSDDGGIYGLKNRSDVSGDSAQRWVKTGTDSYSATSVLTPASDILTMDEGSAVNHDMDDDTSCGVGTSESIDKGNSVGGTPAGDKRRMYISTPGASTADGQRVVAYCYEQGDETSAFAVTWRYLPPSSIGGHNLRRDFHSSIAINEDGTLLAVNDGYVIALRPLRGDFNGDGCRNNFDIDWFALALTDFPGWDECFGDPLGINVLGIGDCNDDGYFDNYDIDCMVEILANDPYCLDDFAACGVGCEGAGGGETAQSRGGSEDWDHFWDVVAQLYEYYGM